jgi:hypothetical protein
MHERFLDRIYALSSAGIKDHLTVLDELFQRVSSAEIIVLRRTLAFALSLSDGWLSMLRVRVSMHILEVVKFIRLDFIFANDLHSTLPPESVFLRVEMRYSPNGPKAMIVGDIDLKALVESKYQTCGNALTLLGMIAFFLKDAYVLRTVPTTTLGAPNSLMILRWKSAEYSYKVWLNFDALESFSRDMEHSL